MAALTLCLNIDCPARHLIVYCGGYVAGWHLDTAVLLALTALAIFQEHTCGPHPTGTATATRDCSLESHKKSLERRTSGGLAGYCTKKAASEGTALGALALPWCFAALLSSAVSSSGNSGQLMSLYKQ